MGIEELVALDGLKRFHWQGKDVLLHEDHRWVLPLVADAQQRGVLPRPVRVILFDRHTDAAEPGPLTPGLSVEAVLRCCQTELSHHDDDWIVAGIQLGLLADVFIFGVEDRMRDLPKAVGDFGIFGRQEMPGKLGPVGIRAQDVLNWTDSPILLDIDLDCFARLESDGVAAWTPQRFTDEFGPSLPLFLEYLNRAGMVTVCREAGCCGGEDQADKIWDQIGKILFDSQLTMNDMA